MGEENGQMLREGENHLLNFYDSVLTIVNRLRLNRGRQISPNHNVNFRRRPHPLL